MDASEKWIVKNYPVHITPNHQPPKMDILPKNFHPCYLMASAACIQVLSTFPKQQRRPLPSLLSDSSSVRETML